MTLLLAIIISPFYNIKMLPLSLLVLGSISGFIWGMYKLWKGW